MRLLLIFNILLTICYVKAYNKKISRDPLPTVITPFEYAIKLTPYLDIEDEEKAFTFDGEISFLLQATEDDVYKIIMNAQFISDIKEINPSNDVKIDDIKMENETMLVLTLNKALVKSQNYTFTLSYRGVLQDDMTGFYKSSYVENGFTKWLATTQFQSNDARKAFPCFDEPYYKSIFKISINCPENYTCLSNMPEESKDGNLIKFYPTPPMSSYIIAFIVSKFVPVRITDADAEKHFAIWSRPEALLLGDEAFEVGPKLVAEFDKYLGVNYYDMDEHIKMDHVAIPDFWPGAMENWGLITYKESYLMHHKSESSIKYKLQTTYVMAHEIAHMWFGNLVTCRYWSHTWLNEAFAAYFQYYLTEKVVEFGLKDQFIINNVQSTLLGDMKSSSQVNYEASNRKGAAVIRMIEHLIEADAFASGLNHYLTTNAYKTVTPKELYDALDEKSDLSSYNTTVNDVMGSWISQAGYPLLTVSVDQASGKITLEQKNFDKEHTNNTETFPIPITCTYEKNADFENTKPLLIMKDSMETIDVSESPGWVIFNIQQTGLYRIMYDDKTWDLLIDVLAKDLNKIHSYNKAQIVDDAFNFAKENLMDYSRMLDIIKFLKHETEYAPWSAAYTGFSYLRIKFLNINKISKLFDELILGMMNTLIEKIGLNVEDDDSNLIKLFRISTLNLACELQHDKCIENSILYYNQLTQNGTSVRPDLREHVYCNALRYGDESSFDFLWSKYERENIATEKVIILGALGCTRNQDKIMELLLKIIDDESGIRDQDRMNAFNSALNGNVENANTVLEFIVNNTDAIKSLPTSRLNTMFINLSSRLSSKGLDEFEQYLLSNTDLSEDDKSNGMTALEDARNDMEWAEGISEEIIAWVKKNSAGSLTATYCLVIFATLYTILNKYM